MSYEGESVTAAAPVQGLIVPHCDDANVIFGSVNNSILEHSQETHTKALQKLTKLKGVEDQNIIMSKCKAYKNMTMEGKNSYIIKTIINFNAYN